jgi:hypothetical protein
MNKSHNDPNGSTKFDVAGTLADLADSDLPIGARDLLSWLVGRVADVGRPVSDGPELHNALVEAQRAARAVSRDAQNTFHGYAYASAECIFDEGRKALGSAGLALTQSAYDITFLERELQNGKEFTRAVLAITYVLIHRSGQSAMTWVRHWPIVEGPGRSFDKALGGALTTALSYTIRDLLLLPRDDEQAAMDRRQEAGGVALGSSSAHHEQADEKSGIAQKTSDETRFEILLSEANVADLVTAIALEAKSTLSAEAYARFRLLAVKRHQDLQ